MNFSVIIPAFHEADKIKNDIAKATQFMVDNDFTGEIIVVDDGSQDATAANAQLCQVPTGIILKVVKFDNNRGKGAAVREGITISQGDYILFADSGCCVPYNDALLGLDLIRTDICQIAHGSRKRPDSNILKAQTWKRRVLSRIFRSLTRWYLGIPRELSDTQCGFKLYRGEVGRILYGQATVDGFMFDIEIILLALKMKYKIREFPVQWTCDLDTRLSATKNSGGVLKEFITIKRRVKQWKNHPSSNNN